MQRIGFNFINEEERLKEFQQAEIAFQLDPHGVKISRTRESSMSPMYKHSYIKRDDGKIFAIAHEMKPSKFYTDRLVTVSDTDCYVWNGFNLYYIFSNNSYRKIPIRNPNKFNKNIKPFLQHEISSFSFISVSNIKKLFQDQVDYFPRAGAFLGKGSYGKVKYAMDISGHLYALKITKTKLSDEAIIAREMSILEGEPFLCQRSGKYYYTFKYLGASLVGELNRHSMDFWDKLDVAIQLCRKLARLHQAGHAHNDIKPSNAVVNSQKSVEWIDFGLSCSIGKQIIKEEGTPIYRPMSCLQLMNDPSAVVLKQRTYGRINLDCIALQKTLFEENEKLQSDIRLFSNEEFALMGTKLQVLLKEESVNQPDFLRLLAAELSSHLLAPNEYDLQVTMGYIKQWSADPILVEQDRYKKIMRQLNYVYTNSPDTWTSMLDSLTKIMPSHQMQLLPFFTYLIRTCILMQSDPALILNTVLYLHPDVQEILFTETDANGMNVCMLATMHSLRYAPIFWKKIEEFSLATRTTILITENTTLSNALMISMNENLPNAFVLLNIQQLDAVSQALIFLQNNKNGLSSLMLCIKQSPGEFFDYLNTIQSLDSAVLNRICAYSVDGWNALLYCIVDYPQGLTALMDIMERLDSSTQYKILMHSYNKEQDNSLTMILDHQKVYIGRILGIIERLDVASQIDIFTSTRTCPLIRFASELKQLVTFKIDGIQDLLAWCGLAETLGPAMFLCATQKNWQELITLACQFNFPGHTSVLLHNSLLTTINPDVALSILLNVGKEPFIKPVYSFFYWMSNFPNVVPILLCNLLRSSARQDVFMDQCARIVEPVYQWGAGAMDKITYHGKAILPAKQIKTFDDNVIRYICRSPVLVRIYHLLLLAYDFTELKKIADTPSNETISVEIMSLYEKCTMLHRVLRTLIAHSGSAVNKGSFDRTNEIVQSCNSSTKEAKEALASTMKRGGGIWQYIILNRIKWAESLVMEIAPESPSSSIGLFAMKAPHSHKRKLEQDSSDQNQVHLPTATY